MQRIEPGVSWRKKLSHVGWNPFHSNRLSLSFQAECEVLVYAESVFDRGNRYHDNYGLKNLRALCQVSERYIFLFHFQQIGSLYPRRGEDKQNLSLRILEQRFQTLIRLNYASPAAMGESVRNTVVLTSLTGL